MNAAVCSKIVSRSTRSDLPLFIKPIFSSKKRRISIKILTNKIFDL